jgi:hypothetical protein
MLSLKHAWSDQDRTWALTYCQQLAGLLERYLEDDSLFITLSLTFAGSPVRGSIGAWLEYQARLSASVLEDAQQDLLAQTAEQLVKTRRMFPDPFQRKVEREARNLLNTWAWVLDECGEDRRRCAADYPDEVWRRTRLYVLLQAALPMPAPLAERLEALDRRLQANFPEGGFVWEPEVEPYYPQATHWWLYRDLTTFGASS